MELTEFFLLNNPSGDIEVKVDFKKVGNYKTYLASIFIKYQELLKLFDNETGWLHEIMTFDEHPYKVSKIVMDVKKHCIIIKTE